MFKILIYFLYTKCMSHSYILTREVRKNIHSNNIVKLSYQIYFSDPISNYYSVHKLKKLSVLLYKLYYHDIYNRSL